MIFPFSPGRRSFWIAKNSKDNPDAHCMPMGSCSSTIIRSPGRSFRPRTPRPDVRGQLRPAADLHRRPSTAEGYADPWWYGYSVGKWEGDTLVVQTTGSSDGPMARRRGSPLTDAAKVTERFRRPNYGTWRSRSLSTIRRRTRRPWTVKVTSGSPRRN